MSAAVLVALVVAVIVTGRQQSEPPFDQSALERANQVAQHALAASPEDSFVGIDTTTGQILVEFTIERQRQLVREALRRHGLPATIVRFVKAPPGFFSGQL